MAAATWQPSPAGEGAEQYDAPEHDEASEQRDVVEQARATSSRMVLTDEETMITLDAAFWGKVAQNRQATASSGPHRAGHVEPAGS